MSLKIKISKYLSGVICREIEHVNGIRHGETKYYYPNGTLEWLIAYNRGNKHGIEQVFYDNKERVLIRQRKENFSNGIFVIF